MGNTLTKKERISLKTDIDRLVSKGRYRREGCLRCCYLAGNGLPYSRIMVSVPKKSFKRAVVRNLLKRRIRESYRVRKSLLHGGIDVLFIYSAKEAHPSVTIASDMESMLLGISKATSDRTWEEPGK